MEPTKDKIGGQAVWVEEAGKLAMAMVEAWVVLVERVVESARGRGEGIWCANFQIHFMALFIKCHERTNLNWERLDKKVWVTIHSQLTRSNKSESN